MKTSMKTFEGKKFFVVSTGIKKESYRKGITSQVLKDDKGNQKYLISIDKDSEGSISTYGLVCNGVDDDGCLSVVIAVADDMTLDDLKMIYGAKLVNAQHCLAELKNQMEREAAAVDSIFAGAAE